MDKIGIISRPVDQGTSGSGFSLIHTLRALGALRDEWEDLFEISLVHYLTGTHHLYREFPEVIVPRNPLRTARRLEKSDFALLHYNPLTVFSPVFGFSGRKVAMIHGAEPDLLPHLYSRPHVWHDRIVVPFLARRIDRVITPSRTTASYLEAKMRLPTPPLVTYNAVSELFPPPPEGKRRELLAQKYGITGPYFFHLSKFSERKNPWILLEAFDRFLREARTPRAHRLLIGGKGWDNKAVDEFVAGRGLTDNVIRAGFLTEEDVALLYSEAEAFVFPSLIEGFGMPNLEAMAYGCPVITTDAFAVKEVVDDAALVLADPHDATGLAQMMGRIVDDEGLRRKLVERGFRRAREFSWEKSARLLLNLYAELLGIGRRWT